MANAVVHFEIPADDVARARMFYEKTFGWTIKPLPMPKGQEYFGVATRKKGEPGIDGGLMKRNMPGQPFTNYITVASIDAMNTTIQANGGTIVMPRREIGPNMGWISAFKDPEDNFIGPHEAPPALPNGRTPAPKGRASSKAAARFPRRSTAKRRR